MRSLFLNVALADEISLLCEEVFKQGLLAGMAMILVIILCTIMVMNVLVAVLVDAISQVADHERMYMHVATIEEEMEKIIARLESNASFRSTGDTSKMRVSKRDLFEILST